jgi:hypothetical protein
MLQLAPKALLEVTPLGKSPVITDGDVTLAESTAIVGNQFFVLVHPIAVRYIQRLSHQ